MSSLLSCDDYNQAHCNQDGKLFNLSILDYLDFRLVISEMYNLIRSGQMMMKRQFRF